MKKIHFLNLMLFKAVEMKYSVIPFIYNVYSESATIQGHLGSYAYLYSVLQPAAHLSSLIT